MSSRLLAPVVEHVPEGIVAVALPTPFPVGDVNCYLLLDEPLTVVDPGMRWADSTDILTAALREVGRELADVDQVVVTHGHPDHFGAAGWLAEVADAPVLCGRAEVPKVTGAAANRPALLELAGRLGLPDSLRATAGAFFQDVRHLAHPIDEGRLRLLDDGDLLAAGGRDWRVHVTPGHAVGHVSLFDADARVLVSGDHLLASVTPNPVLEPDPAYPDGRRRSLVEYLASLERFVRLDPLVVLPGHGPRFSAVATLVHTTRRHHARRAADIARLVRRLGDATVYELASELFPEARDFSVLLGISEVVGHLDLLEDEGRVARSGNDRGRYVLT